jgi:hypothetical protein
MLFLDKKEITMLKATTVARPAILDVKPADWVQLSNDEAVKAAQDVFEYFKAVCGETYYSFETFYLDCSLDIRRFRAGAHVVGQANSKGVTLNSKYLFDGDHQAAVIQETIAHEMAHVVILRRIFGKSWEECHALGLTSKNYKILHHGREWKKVFMDLSGFKKINSRFFGKVER